MSEDPQKQHEIKFRVSTKERSFIDEARRKAGVSTRADFVRKAVLAKAENASCPADLAELEKRLGELGLNVNRLREGAANGSLTRQKAKRLAQEVLATISMLRRRFGCACASDPGAKL